MFFCFEGGGGNEFCCGFAFHFSQVEYVELAFVGVTERLKDDYFYRADL